jgi:15-cis-phytoene synthase
MAKGSKSFSLAALLFDGERKIAARHLYSWCRHCDDAVDNAPSAEAAQKELDQLTHLTHVAFQAARHKGPLAANELSNEPAFQALSALCTRYGIPEFYPLELLEGMRMDVEGMRYRTTHDLELYCYRVASVVGLMMVHVMGVSSQKALMHAIDTGLAMQMTNIARDILDDFKMGRIYIPESWFLEAGLQVPALSEPFSAQHFTVVVKRLLAQADWHYASGRKGLKYLPFRAALAVAAAQEIYREIGVKVLARGEGAWQTRTVVPFARKIWLLTKATARVCAIMLPRLIRPWQPIDLNAESVARLPVAR